MEDFTIELLFSYEELFNLMLLKHYNSCTGLNYSLNVLLLHTGNCDIFSIHVSWSVHAVLIENTTLVTKKDFCRPQ